MNANDTTPEANWLNPAVEETGLARYVSTIRERKWLIALTVLVTTLAATVYVITAPKVYKAEADLLITPVTGGDETLSGLGLLSVSSDPTRDVETASKLVASNNVARRVKAALKDPRGTGDILNSVEVQPVATSNIVAITAEGGSPREAQRLANAFAEQAVANRTDAFHEQLDQRIESLKPQADAEAKDPAAAADPNSLSKQLARLRLLRAGPDPTIRVETPAEAPAYPSSPRTRLSIAVGIVAGLVLGVGGAFALQVLDPRLRREEQLRRLYGLPILARIPHDPRAHGSGALAPESLSPSTIEAYRTLRATLSASRGGEAVAQPRYSSRARRRRRARPRAPSTSPPRWLWPDKVILIEADLRRPAIGKALGVEPRHGTGSVLLETVELEEALETTRAYGKYLQLVVADYSGAASGWMADRLFLPSTHRIVAKAKKLADYVIIDSPPLSEVIDALPLAQRADAVLVVVRLGKTQLTKLAHLGELLSRHGVRPVGFAVVGAKATGDGYYYSSAPRPQRGNARERGERERSDGREPTPRQSDALIR